MVTLASVRQGREADEPAVLWSACPQTELGGVWQLKRTSVVPVPTDSGNVRALAICEALLPGSSQLGQADSDT